MLVCFLWFAKITSLVQRGNSVVAVVMALMLRAAPGLELSKNRVENA